MALSEFHSDWESGRDGIEETSSRGRHIKKINFDDKGDDDYIPPQAFKGQKPITGPPPVTFKGKIEHACVSRKFLFEVDHI